MINQSFDFKQFRNLQRRGDIFLLKCDSDNIKRKLTELEILLQNNVDNYEFSSFKTIKKNGKVIYLLDKCSNNFIWDEFILRKINHNIKRIYKVKQADRNTIVNQIFNILKENPNYYIYRLDISSFYESMDRSRILNKILASSIISVETKILLQKVFKQIKETSGLPRGLNISATLAELYMKDFDHDIITTDGVFYYARFVDDIIIFSIRELSFDFLNKILKERTLLKFNNKKTKIIKRDANKQDSFEYLGYQYVTNQSSTKSKKSNITINIAPKKINKIKTKIIYSLLDYKKNKNFKLLKNRFLFLTCTYPIKTLHQKISPYKNSGYLQGGLFYNYNILSDDNHSLKELDKFVCNILFSNNIYSQTLNLSQKKELAKYSFTIAYNRKFKRNTNRITERTIYKLYNYERKINVYLRLTIIKEHVIIQVCFK